MQGTVTAVLTKTWLAGNESLSKIDSQFCLSLRTVTTYTRPRCSFSVQPDQTCRLLRPSSRRDRFFAMSAEHPRAYSYIASQDFSANASASVQHSTALPSSYAGPQQYVQQQQHHVYPPSNSGHQPRLQANPQEQWLELPPMEPQSLAPPPKPNMTSKPHHVQEHPYGPAPDIGPPQGQQYGQISFDEKFRPADNKPKWNDVIYVTQARMC